MSVDEVSAFDEQVQ